MAIPVILDTDIGFDVDDVWALAFLLRCHELDVKLVVTNTGDTEYSSRIVAKLLQIAGRSNIPVGTGIPIDTVPRTHTAWLGEYALIDYPGQVIDDGVGAIIDQIHESDEQVVIISIGPLSNIAAALTRDESITGNSRFIGMHGSIRRGYLGAPKPMKEYNVKTHTAACQKVFATPWDLSITPLDTCALVSLKDENFQRVLTSGDPLAKAVMDNHFGWFEEVKNWPVLGNLDASRQSSVLYDTVAVYMAYSEALLQMEKLPIVVMDDGKTMVSDEGQPVNCAMGWHNLTAFESLVAERLASDQGTQSGSQSVKLRP
jgi:inosine-uridine nucleoside N-ribohydrolase